MRRDGTCLNGLLIVNHPEAGGALLNLDRQQPAYLPEMQQIHLVDDIRIRIYIIVSAVQRCVILVGMNFLQQILADSEQILIALFLLRFSIGLRTDHHVISPLQLHYSRVHAVTRHPVPMPEEAELNAA